MFAGKEVRVLRVQEKMKTEDAMSRKEFKKLIKGHGKLIVAIGRL